MRSTPIWAPAGLNQTLATLGMMPANLVPRMSKGGTIEPFPGVKITMVHADHSSEMILKYPATGKNTSFAAGEPCGFIIELENGFKIYHMGDTGLFGDMKLIGEYYKPDLILVPIGGHFVMDPKDAAVATRDYLKPKYALPFHYGTFPPLKGTPQEYMAALGNTLIKRHGSEVSSALLNRNGLAIGALLLIAAALAVEQGAPMRWTPAALASIAYLSLFGTVLAFGLYFWLLRHAPAYRVSLISYVTPAIALLLGALAGDEPLTAATLGGTALILCGVALVMRSQRRA